MSDNHRRYCAIHEALSQGYPGQISGRMVQHLTILAALLSGIVASKSSQLPQIALKLADRAKTESRVKRFSRWFDNDQVKEEIYFLPYTEWLLQCLSLETLVLVMHGSVVGRGGCALTLPLAWRLRQVPKGHFPEDFHMNLVDLVMSVIPAGTEVVFLRDGEFDGIHLQGTMNDFGWHYVCRTASRPFSLIRKAAVFIFRSRKPSGDWEMVERPI